MSGINENYSKILSEIEQKISNPQEKEFVKNKISELMLMFMDIIDKISDITEMEMNDIEERQKELKLKIDSVANKVSKIEGDIYEDDENFDFEIVCPYCNHEFVADLDGENNEKNEVECPECHNIIELDWNEEDEELDGCSGFCDECHGCAHDHYDEEFDDEDDFEKDSGEDDNDDEDM